MRNFNRTSVILGALSLVTAILLTAPSAHAGLGVGGRAGLSVSPDQFVIGGQANFGAIMPLIDFVPSVDLGFGDNVDLTTINLDFAYDLPSLPKVSANLYAGAGPTIAMYNPDGGGNDTDVGLSLVAGLKTPMTAVSYYNLEVRFGLADVPDLKVLLGIMFGL